MRSADGGSHQRHSNWYRCRFVWNRGKVAADTAGHPRSLQIKEETILREVIDFMGRRIFGPDRLRPLRLDLARSIGDSWREHDTEVKRLEREQEHISARSTGRRFALRSPACLR